MTQEPIAYRAYQKLADSYAARIDKKPHNAYYDRPAMLSLLPDVDQKSVLDAGCGPGAYAEQLVKRGAQVVAIDVSDRMLELATQRLGPYVTSGKVELRSVDMTQPLTMFQDQQFDVVNAPLCLDYIADWLSLFKEFYRVLKPGGRFLFSAGHPSFDAEHFKTTDYFSVEQVSCIWRGFGTPIRMPSYRRSIEQFINPIVQAGFALIQILEPQPTEQFRQVDRRRYDSLMHRPGFLCALAEKRA